jgi:mono/diheme cytochrome c family protein
MNKLILLGLVAAGSLAVSQVRAADGADVYAQNCAKCHGKDGAGHSKAGRMLKVKDLTDATYQKTFTDDQIAQDLKNGLKDADGKQRMNPFGDKLSDDDVKAVVAYVRTLAK